MVITTQPALSSSHWAVLAAVASRTSKLPGEVETGMPVTVAPATCATSHAASDLEPRVWLVGGAGSPPPTGDDRPALSDLNHLWLPASDGGYRTEDGRHYATWAELHARYDLIEVLEGDTCRGGTSKPTGRPQRRAHN